MCEKSFIARVAEFILSFTKPKYMDSKVEVENFLAMKSKIQDKHIRSVFKSADFNGVQVFTFGNKETCKNIILYAWWGLC